MNRKMSLQSAIVGLLLTIAGASVGQSGPAPGSRRFPISEEAQENFNESATLDHIAAVDLHIGRYTQAEAEAREAISLDPIDGLGKEVLAAALYAQGKDEDALQAYQTVVEHFDRQPRNLVPYAQLLLKSGQWEKAVTVYNQVISRDREDEPLRADSHFSPDVPEPAALEIALHIARGRTYSGVCGWAGEPQNKEAMAEFGKALQLAPDNALTNYYYGVGWERLSPTERTKFGTAAQAKAALLKAFKVGKGDVKKAAKKALLVAINTK